MLDLVMSSVLFSNVVNVNLILGGSLLDWLQYWDSYWRVCEGLSHWTVLPDWWWREGKKHDSAKTCTVGETGANCHKAFYLILSLRSSYAKCVFYLILSLRSSYAKCVFSSYEQYHLKFYFWEICPSGQKSSIIIYFVIVDILKRSLIWFASTMVFFIKSNWSKSVTCDCKCYKFYKFS